MLIRVKLLDDFLKLESASGILLFIAAIFALLWVNSSLKTSHGAFVQASSFLINEGLMAIFFLLVGLELKREFTTGELSHVSQILLPGVAAIGGMVIPALIYGVINSHNPITLKGWATPVATDIAFALGVLSLFGRRVPIGLKLFLMALAIFDDIGAILIIGLFYSHGMVYLALFLSILLVLLLYIMNRKGIESLALYLIVGSLLWVALLYSGVHPTIAGVLLALFIPLKKDTEKSPLHRLETQLHPWVAYLIMPLFALANAGFSFDGLSMGILTDDVVLGIVFGLFIGKQLGVFGFTWVFIKLGFASLPVNVTWLGLYGVAILCGIGFTMSLFLGTLSFQNQGIYLSEVRLGVMIGSILSGLIGGMVLLMAFPRPK